VPSEQKEPLLTGLDSDAYAETIEQYWELLLTDSDTAVRERVMTDLRATPKETVVGFFWAHSEYDPLPALRLYGGPKLAVITPANDASFALHNLGADLPHTTFTGTGHWLQMDKPAEFNRMMDEFLARVEASATPH
jgi:pimeloyl-ACP methyl ester carboxylesterase